jgi:hypothetical protein
MYKFADWHKVTAYGGTLQEILRSKVESKPIDIGLLGAEPRQALALKRSASSSSTSS